MLGSMFGGSLFMETTFFYVACWLSGLGIRVQDSGWLVGNEMIN